MIVQLNAAGAGLVLDTGAGLGGPLPTVLHWGPELGEVGDELALALHPPIPHSATDEPVPRRLLPMPCDGWTLRPGLVGSRADGSAWSPRFLVTALDVGAGAITLEAADEDAGLAVSIELRMHPSGVLAVDQAVRNLGRRPYLVGALAASLPVPAHAVELLDLTGRWTRERAPQRHRLAQGTWLREGRHGRSGHDSPLVMAAGTAGFGFRSGQVWAGHLAWSGDSAWWAERNADGQAGLGAAERLGQAEVTLGQGETYQAPTYLAVYSGRGLDGVTAAFHKFTRARPSHPRTPRPVVLNTWEAVYFDHRLERLAELADVAARVGVERFVLDDGWLRGRRGDRAGLGDWYVDAGVWPDGLGPLVEHVTGLGMRFGLWVEPEMVNADSDLFRAHPDWVLAQPGRLPVSWRHQHVLDLADPGAWGYLLERLDALLSEYDIAFFKWDHNRDLIEPEHQGRPGTHAQTLAVYRLMDELRAKHPGLEIESCASGGARVDLGILARTDRVWASDTNDALERQHIQLWTGLLLPPELVGAHVGPPEAHTTGRTHGLPFRAATALFGHFGIEWDIAAASAEEQKALAEAITVYKRLRGLLHSGEVVRGDDPEASAILHGVVALDRSEAVFAWVQLAPSTLSVPGRVRLPGLDPDAKYLVEPLAVGGEPLLTHSAPPPWYAAGGVSLGGRALAEAGLELPVLAPEQALVLHLRREAT